MKPVKPIRTEAQYDRALAEIERYIKDEPAPGTADADRYDLLTMVINDYEQRHWPIAPPEPLDAIRFMMDIKGYTQADLGRVLGSRQRASDILKGRRSLTLPMIRRLHAEWGIPADSLIGPILGAKAA